jgi:Synaphin protein
LFVGVIWWSLEQFINKQLFFLSFPMFSGAVGGDGGGDDETDKEKEEEAERERQEAIKEAEERRKEKHRKMEEEREKMRQEIRDKVSTNNQYLYRFCSNNGPCAHWNAEKCEKPIEFNQTELKFKFYVM